MSRRTKGIVMAESWVVLVPAVVLEVVVERADWSTVTTLLVTLPLTMSTRTICSAVVDSECREGAMVFYDVLTSLEPPSRNALGMVEMKVLESG